MRTLSSAACCGGRDRAQRVVAVLVLPPQGIQPVEARDQLGLVVTGERHEEQRRRVALERAGQLGVLHLLPGQVEDRLVHHLDLGGVAGQRVLGRRDGRRHRREVADCEDGSPWLGHQVDDCPRRDDQRPLRPDDELREVERRAVGQPVQPVAAGPPPEGREVARDGPLVPRQDLGQPGVDAALEGVARGPPGPLRLVDRLEPRPAAVGEHDVQRPDVVDGHAVADAAAAGRVVADHPADRGAVAGRGVRTEHQAVRRRGAVQAVLHDADVDHCCPGLRVDLVDAVHVARHVQHQPGADGLPGQAGAGAAGDHRHAERRSRRHCRGDVVAVPGEGHSERADGVHAGVAREQVAGVVVEGDLAVEVAAQQRLQLEPELGTEGGGRAELRRLGHSFSSIASAAVTPSGSIGTPASRSPICTPDSVPARVRSLKCPR